MTRLEGAHRCFVGTEVVAEFVRPGLYCSTRVVDEVSSFQFPPGRVHIWLLWQTLELRITLTTISIIDEWTNLEIPSKPFCSSPNLLRSSKFVILLSVKKNADNTKSSISRIALDLCVSLASSREATSACLACQSLSAASNFSF